MLIYMFGTPGSGKSFWAVNKILDYINSDRDVYTNIQLVNFESNRYHYLDYQSFLDIFQSVQDIFSDQLDIDTYVSKLKSIFPKGSVWILDEIHLFGFADRKNDYLRNFLSIYRHLHIDILLLTQSVKNVRLDLLDFGDIYIRAVPPTMRFRKSVMEYVHYSSLDALKKMDKLFRIKVEMYKFDKNIFSLYDSGANNQGSGGLRRKIFLLVFGLFFVVIYIIYAFYHAMHVSSDKLHVKDNNITLIDNNRSVVSKIVRVSNVSHPGHFTTRCSVSRSCIKGFNFCMPISGGLFRSCVIGGL